MNQAFNLVQILWSNALFVLNLICTVHLSKVGQGQYEKINFFKINIIVKVKTSSTAG